MTQNTYLTYIWCWLYAQYQLYQHCDVWQVKLIGRRNAIICHFKCPCDESLSNRLCNLSIWNPLCCPCNVEMLSSQRTQRKAFQQNKSVFLLADKINLWKVKRSQMERNLPWCLLRIFSTLGAKWFFRALFSTLFGSGGMLPGSTIKNNCASARHNRWPEVNYFYYFSILCGNHTDDIPSGQWKPMCTMKAAWQNWLNP